MQNNYTNTNFNTMNSQMNQLEGGELFDNQVISVEDLGDYNTDFTPLPVGDYDFTIVDLVISRHQNRGGKVGDCKQINPVFRVLNPETQRTVDIKNYNLFMWNSQGCKNMIAQYYDSIGLHKSGQPLSINWEKSAHVGKTGKLKISHETFTNKNGEEKVTTKISKLYSLEEVAKQTQTQQQNNWNWK